MDSTLLLVGALLTLGAVAFWYLKVVEDPSVIDQEETNSVRNNTSHEDREPGTHPTRAEKMDLGEIN